MSPPESKLRSAPAPVTSVATVEETPRATQPHVLHVALAGDSKAWEEIVEQYTNLLWWVARSHRLDEATSADVVQTVWLQLLRFGDRIRDPERLGAWLATTARREALRRTKPGNISLDDVRDDADRHAPEVDEQLLDDETIGIVLAAFRLLSAEDQQLLKLVCDVPPRSYAEIADLLGKSHGHIGPTRQRALNRLRAHLTQMGLS